MEKISQYFLACCLVIIGLVPSDAFASYALTMANGFRGTLLPSSTLYLNSGNTMPSFCNCLDVTPPIMCVDATTLTVPASGRITAVQGNIFSVVPGSGEACTINIIQNGTTITRVTNSLVIGAEGQNAFSNNSLNVSVQAGDLLQMQIVTPAWIHVPMNSSFSVSLYIE